MRVPLLFLAAMYCAAAPALGQGAGLNLFGTVERMESGRLVIKTDAGVTRDFSLDPKLLVLKNTPTTLAEIKANDFIASAAMPGPDGKLHSTEVRIYPNALRGIGEGQRAMSGAPGQTMTNATVEGAAIVQGSNVVRVTFPGGASELVVDPGVPVTKIEQIELTEVKPGMSVRVQGQQNAEGSVASRITLQK